MIKLSIWHEIHDEVAELQKLVDPKLANTVEAVAVAIHCNPGLSKKEIRQVSAARTKNVSHVLKKLVQLGWLKTKGRGVRRDPKTYTVNESAFG